MTPPLKDTMEAPEVALPGLGAIGAPPLNETVDAPGLHGVGLLVSSGLIPRLGVLVEDT